MTDAPTIIAIICYLEWGLIHIAAGCMTSFPMGGAGGGACTAGPAAGGLVPSALMGALSEEEKDALKAVKYAGRHYHHQPRAPTSTADAKDSTAAAALSTSDSRGCTTTTIAAPPATPA